MKYELKKLFTKRVNKILIAAMIALAVISSIFAIGSMYDVDKDGRIHSGVGAARSLTEAKNQWKGRLTPEVMAKVVLEAQQTRKRNSQQVKDKDTDGLDSLQPYVDIEFMINAILSGDDEYNQDAILKITPRQAEELYSIREKHISEMAGQESNSPVKQVFLENKYRETKVPFYYEAADSWKTMIVYARFYGIAIVVLIGLITAGIFADEFQLKADTIFFSSWKGRRKAVRDKLWTGMLAATVVYWGAMLILSAISFAVMGVSGAKTPIQVEEAYSIYTITYGEAYLIVLLCGYIASLLSASISMLIAAKSHSTILAVFGPLVLFCALPFIGIASQFDTFFVLTPDVLTNIYICIGTPFVYEIGGIVFRQVPFVMVLYTITSLAILPLIYRSYSRYGIGKSFQRLPK